MDSLISKKEKEILKFWQDNKIFEKSLKKKAPKGDYVFYDGPPFATGTPHYGHIPSSIMKDVVPRFWTMNGYQVARRWGWDCHGLPVENLIEKELKLENKKDIEEKIGVCGFNDACKLSVLRYADVWKQFIPRIGRWVDMEDDYKTMDPHYMESIWWVFKTLYDKGLIYKSYKAMHICPRCDTTLSNFEVTQNYKDVKDISAMVKFELIDEPGTFVLAWTTTPWTLPGNVALAVGENIDYVKILYKGEKFIVADGLDSKIFPFGDGNERTWIDHKIIKSKDLVGKKYKPLFDYFVKADLKNKENLYAIQIADFVTTEDGTGVVHIAPGFGEDDLNLGKAKNLPTIIHVTPDGKFKPEVKDFAGAPVKPVKNPQATDKKIVEYLQAKNLLFKSEEFTHSYPHCWRCDTPLLNYATSSWFVKVTDIKKDLIKNNQKVHWTPAHLQSGRFGKWLENASDWSISRQRYWGTPLPIWQCVGNLKSQISNLKSGGCGNVLAVGSMKELEKLSGKKVEDLHKHIVDEITLPCGQCGGELKRIPDVLDCWFESGSMPYAQVHYPFENKAWFEKNFPAEFIAEGVDQTRGWFYTLMVLSTALFDKPAFNNVVVNGIVLAANGQKMSKRLKNYPEPDLVIEQFGADALRYYLLTSPVMEAESLNFSEAGVKEALQKVVMLAGNVLSFYLLYADDTNKNVNDANIASHVLDKWILAKLNLLIEEVTENMNNYNLVKAARPIEGFINELSTWYLRRSRDRFKQATSANSGSSSDMAGINTLGHVLREFAKVAAPFIPFTAEEIYQAVGGEKESVHLEDWPAFAKATARYAGASARRAGQAQIVQDMIMVRQIVEKGLAARAEAGVKIRQPLASYATSLIKKLDKDVSALITDELNIKEIKFGAEDKLDTEISAELKLEGLSRELIRQINSLRKVAGLTIIDKVVIYQTGLAEVFGKFGEEILQATLAQNFETGETEEMKEIEGGKIGIKKV